MKRRLSLFLIIAMLLSMVPLHAFAAEATEPSFREEMIPEKSPPKRSADYSVWDGTVADGFARGIGTIGQPYIIETAAQLAYLEESVNAGKDYAGEFIALVTDIDLNGYYWTPIGSVGAKTFCGTLNGNGHTIYGLAVTEDSASEWRGGLFSRMDGTCYYLNICDAVISYSGESPLRDYVGILAGDMTNGTVDGCFVSGTITCTDIGNIACIGGMVGLSSKDSNIRNSDSQVTIQVSGSGTDVRIGGLCAENLGKVWGINSAGTITASFDNSYAGGLVGLNGGIIEECYSTANVTLKGKSATVGGLIGWNTKSASAEESDFSSSRVNNCYAVGTVCAEGPASGGTIDAGGLIGYMSKGVINNSYAGNPSVKSILSSVSKGVNANAGKLIGRNGEEAVIRNCYANVDMTISRSYYIAAEGGCGGQPERNGTSGSATCTVETGTFDYDTTQPQIVVGWIDEGDRFYDGPWYDEGGDPLLAHQRSQGNRINYWFDGKIINVGYIELEPGSTAYAIVPTMPGYTPDQKEVQLYGGMVKDVTYTHYHVPGPSATCISVQTCTVCQEVLSGYGYHSYRVTNTITPSCETTGYTVLTCSVCGHVKNDYFKTATGHQLDSSYRCTVCNEQFSAPLREYTVYVYDAETNKPLADAIVKIGTASAHTNQHGAAVFELAEETKATLTVYKENYPDYESKNFAVSQMPCTYVYLASAKSGITEAWCNGDNVLVIDSQINCKTPALSAKIVVSGRAEANILKYQLVQGDQVIATSTNGEFIVANPHFLQNKPVYARMYTDGQNGFNMFERELNISVVGFQLNLELDDLLPFSAGLDIDFENGMPLLDGISFQLPDIDLGENGFFNFSVKNEKAIFTFGMEKDSFDKDLDDKSPKEIMKQLRNKFKQQNNPKAWPKGKPKSEVSVSGAIIIEFGKDAKVTSTYGEVHIGYELSYKWGKTFVVWIVPVYAGFKAGLEGELVLTEFGYDFENSEILIPDVDANIQAEIAAYGGVGCSLVSAGIYGAVGGEIKMGVKDFQEYFRYKLYGEMGLYARVDLFFWKELEYRYPLLYGEFFGPNGQIKKSILSPESYETASRDYLENRSPWLASPMIPKRGVADSHALLQTSSYHAIEPRIVTNGDTIMMLFLDDDGSEGFNYQHLRYSLFDKDSNSWGEPKRVDDAEFADLEYDVYADASGIYLAYTKPGAITEENKEDFSAIMAGVEVYTAKYDPETQAFTDHTNVSCNDTLDSQPQITKDTVVWVNNFTNDGLAQNANNVLMLAKKTGSTWSDATALDEHGATVSSMDMGVLDGKPYVAVIRDVDCDLMTDTDRRLELLDTDGNVIQVTNSAGNEAKQEMVDHNGDVYYMTEGAKAIEGVRFEQVDGQDVVQWYGHENIWQISTANATPVSLLENPEQGLTGEFQFVRIDENKSMILFAKNSVEDQKAGSSLYAIYYTDGQWGDPVPLTEMVEKTYVDAFDGCAYQGKLLMAYISTEAEVTADAIDRTSNFMTSWMQIKDDLTVGKVDYLETELFEGSSITLQVPVTNQSWQKLQNITVELQSSQGTAVYSQQVQLEAALESGETDYVSITVPKENLSNTEQYSVHVTSRDWSDDNASNDTVPVMLWYTDFEVNAQQMVNAAEQYIQYAVTNSGNTAGTGTLVIYKKVGADRVELHSAPVSLAVGKTYTDKVRVEPNFYSDGQEGVVFVEIKPAVEELYNFNNSQSLALTQVKQSTTNDITGSEEAIPAPVMKTPSAVYDLQSGGSIAVEATENGWSFTGIQELDPSRYTYSAARLQLPEQYLQTLSVGYHYYTLTYSQKGKTSEANFILEVCDTGPKPAPLSVQDVVVTYDGMPVGLSELGYKTSSNGEVTARYRENGSWISGLPTEMGEYTVELTVGADRDNHYSATTAQFRLTVVKGTRAISVPTRITQADGSVYFADAIATAAAQDGQITYGYSLVNDAATVTEWSAQGILPKADVPTQYYVFARITGGTKYDDAVSLGYAVDAHVHGYQDTVIKPTTSAQGYTLHTCACGHSYKDSFVDKLTYIVGDVNRDGRVNTQDRILLARYLAKWIGYDAQKIDLLAADVNGDGRVNTQDRIILARYLAKWIGYEKLPADD